MQVDIKTEVAGKIWTIDAVAGNPVAAGDSVVTVESMKMEIPVEVEVGGLVSEVLVSQGESVEEGQTVARIALP